MAINLSWLDWGLLVFVLLLLQSPMTQASLERRCHESNNETASFLERLQQAPCVPCQEIPINVAFPPIEAHVVILATTPYAFEKFVVVVPGLLREANQVTLLCSSAMPPERDIRQYLLQSLPCNQHVLANERLNIRYFKLEETPCKLDRHFSSGDILWCSVQSAEKIAIQLTHELQKIGRSSLITTMIVEATFIAGLIVAESMLVPTISWIDSTGLLRLVLGAPQEQITLRSLWSYVTSRLQLRLQTFDLSSFFCAYNKLRHKMGLPRIRRMADLWNRGFILLTSLEQGKLWQHQAPNLITLDGPLVPPCMPCTNNDVSLLSTEKPKILVTIANANSAEGRKKLRKLLQGLSLVRASLHEYADCGDCWDGITDFEVVRLAPPVNITLPPFVLSKPGAFLDRLAQTHNVVQIISLCDDKNRWTQTLGPPVLCFSFDWSCREIAQKVLRLLRNPPPIEPTRAQDLDEIISIAQVLSQVKKQYGGWTDAVDMLGDMLHHLELDNEENESDLFGSILVYPAWAIVVLSVMYLLLKDTWKPQPQLWRRWQHQQPSSLMEAFVLRLPDLDRTLALWSEWAREQWTELYKPPVIVEKSGNASARSKRRTHHRKKH